MSMRRWRNRLMHLFTAMNRLGTTVVVATHDVSLINATPGAQLIRLENGTMVDPTGTLRNPPAAAERDADVRLALRFARPSGGLLGDERAARRRRRGSSPS